MKRKLLLCLLTACLLVGLLAFPAAAETTQDGLEYSMNYVSGEDENAIYTISIVYYTGTAAEVVIPAEIEGWPVTEITASAFANNTTVTSVTIPDSVTTLGTGIFMECSALETVVLPSGITTIPQSTFTSCRSLTSVNIPSSVTTIGAEAFTDCSSLTELELPEGLRVIGGAALQATGLVEVTLPASLEAMGTGVFSYCESLTSVTLPEGMTEIPNDTFRYCSALKEVDLPESLESIGDHAFSGAGLTSVSLPESVKALGTGVFSHCESLTTATLNESLTEIPQDAFFCCTALSEVSLPDSLKTIGVQAFSTCTSLTEIVLPENLQTIADKAFPFSGLKSITVPDSVTSLGDEAFAECSALGYAKIGDGVTSIASGTFGNCSKLAELHVGNGVTTIDPALWQDLNIAIFEFGTGITKTYPTIPEEWFSGDTAIAELTMHGDVDAVADYAFADCTSLQKVIFTGSAQLDVGTFGFRGCTALESLLCVVDETAEEPEYTTIYLCNVGDNGFIDCSSLKNVDIAAGGQLGARSFMACTSLTELNVRASATIGDEAFALCSNLETVYLYTRNIGTGAFKACAKLKTAGPAYADGDFNVRYWFDDYLGSEMSYFTYLEALTVGEGITQIESNALYGCLYLKEVHLPSTMTYISWNAFPAEGSLSTVTIPTIGDWLEINFESTSANPLSFGAGLYIDDVLVEDLVIPETVKNVGKYNFAGYEKLKSLSMESGVETLGDYAFYNCKNLESITFCNTLKEMGYASFDGCTKVKSITLPDRLMAIPSYCFANCSSLQEVTMPKYMSTVSDHAFYNCSKLNKVTLPEFLTEIGDSAFYNCTSLTGIDLPSDVTTIGNHAFSNCTALESIVLPDKILNLSDGLFYNCTELSEVTLPANLLGIGSNSFAYCKALKQIDLPDTVKQMGMNSSEGVFAYSGLTSIDLPDALTEVPASCFYWCTDLTSVTLHEGIEKIGSHAFGSTKLAEINLPESVTEIGSYAFYNCQQLKELELPAKLESLGENVFRSCDALKELTLPENCAVGEYAIRDSGIQTLYIPAGIQTVPRSLWCTSVETVIFTGDMPELHAKTFSCAENIGIEMKIAALYPQGNETYTDETMIDYGCSTVWYPYDENGVIAEGESDGIHWSVIGSKLTVWGSGSTEALYDTNLMPHEAYPWYRLRNQIETAEIKSGITGLYDYTLSGLTKLAELSLPEGLTHMGNNLFTDTALTEVTVPSTVTSWGNSEYSSTIYTFSYAPQLKSVTFAEGMTKLPENLFSNDLGSYVETVVLPSTMEIIKETFTNARSLKNINLPEGLQNMYNAFYCCDGLTEVTIPSTVTNYAYAFSNCDNLTTVTILPTDDEVVSYHAFYGCDSLTTVNLPEGLESLDYSVFAECTSLESIVFPEGMVTMQNNMFDNCTSLKSVTLPDSLGYMPNHMFQNCSSLKTVEIPTGITSLSSVFYNCTGLEEIVVPSSVRSLDNAFENCTNLKKVTIEPGIQFLGYRAFYGCSALESITVPHSVTNIENHVFIGCKNLTEVTFLGDKPSHITVEAFKGATFTAYYPGSNTSWDSFDFGSYGGTVTWKALPSNCTTHTYSEWGIMKPATCTEDGTSRQTCTTCGAYAEKSIPATGHTKGTLEEKVEVNGCQEGYSEYSCATCGSWFQTDFVAGQPHDWSNWYCYDGNCESGCWVSRNCEVCATEESKYIEPTSHTFDPWSNEQPTCTNSAWPYHRCTTCGFTEMKEIPATGHSYGKWIVNMEPGCNYDGDQYRECANCGEREWSNIPATDHSYVETVIKANCQQGGFILHECTKCGEKYESDHQPSTDHTYKTTVYPATCESDGHTHYQCSVCGYGYDGDQTAQLPHTFGEWVTVQQPDYNHNGLKERVCTSCGNAKESEEIPPLADNQPYNPFVDVAQGKFYYDAVLWAADTGVTTGITATTFEPGKTCTRAQVVTFLWRAAGSPEPTSTNNPFVDVVEGKFYYKAVLWAVEQGITNGVDATHFGTNDECTRGHVATFLWRTLNKPAATGSNPFSDVKAGKFYYDAVLWAAETGVTTGTAPGKFDPTGTCTRGQIVTFLYRALGSK